jgi:uncharacterized membrane protein YeiH
MDGFALPAALDLAAVFVFALSGALLAGRTGLDVFGMFVCAFVTGVGGGSIRDVLLDRPVFWLEDARYLIAAMAATALVFWFGARIERLDKPLRWADALGLALATPLGVAAARSVDAELPIQIAMGVVTASFGGVVRDVLCGAPPMILHREVYATAALGGAAVNVVVFATGAGAMAATLACVGATFLIRACAIVWGWSAPTWRKGRASMARSTGA